MKLITTLFDGTAQFGNSGLLPSTNFIRPVKAPVIRAGPMAANFSWNTIRD